MQAWTSPQWRALAVRWLDEQLRGHAIERTGAVTQPRVRPWATVLTAPTTLGEGSQRPAPTASCPLAFGFRRWFPLPLPAFGADV